MTLSSPVLGLLPPLAYPTLSLASTSPQVKLTHPSISHLVDTHRQDACPSSPSNFACSIPVLLLQLRHITLLICPRSPSYSPFSGYCCKSSRDLTRFVAYLFSQGVVRSVVDTDWDSPVLQAAPSVGRGEGTCMASVGFHLDTGFDYT